MNWKEAERILDEIKRRTKKRAYSLAIEKDRHPDLLDSKFGGLPYWDINQPYPVDSNGKKMMLLAQINFERMFQKVERDELLPEKGMLQFFIGMDDVFGMDFDEQDRQKNFRVIYHENIREQVTPEQIKGMEIPVSTDKSLEEYTPIWVEAAIEVKPQEVYMGEGDYHFDDLFGKIAGEMLGEDQRNQSLYQLLDDDAYDKVMEELSNENHWLLGYPYFTQSDPREYEERYQYYDTLLFQMDSDDAGENSDWILWGDCGVANFFINQEDLKNRDFSKVLYNWDCC
ncbi:MAG: DUF1963 domain-containing protein [Lachnospiraceae bacterium]|nr:DUF1963 domain-containing protein [Lachnospiraceae bacterium]